MAVSPPASHALVAAAQAALAAEYAAVYGYGVVGARVGAGHVADARAAYAEHRARRDAMNRAVRDLGAEPVAADAAYALPFPVPDAASAVRLAAVLEDRVAGAYADLVRASDGGNAPGRGSRGAGRGGACRALAGHRYGLPGTGGTCGRRGADRVRERLARQPVNHRQQPAGRRDQPLMAAETDVPLEPPERLAATVAAREGGSGRAWLAALPGLAAQYLERWELTPVRVQRPGGNTSMVVLVTGPDGAPAVLKLGMVTPGTREEHAALAHWDGRGAVRLLRADPGHGVLLLERLRAEVCLRSLPEAKAMLEAAGVLRRLWVPPDGGHPFTTVADRTAELARTLREHREQPWAARARPLVDEALAVRDRLAAGDAGGLVLLHGDFHHGDVLAADRAPWLAVGPEPLVGDPAYDLARLARDRLETLVGAPAARSAARRRLAKLADALDVDRDRLRDWSVFRSVSAGVRSLAAGDRRDGELLLEFAAWL